MFACLFINKLKNSNLNAKMFVKCIIYSFVK